MSKNNSLLQKSSLRFGAYPFSKIKESDYLQAFEIAIKEKRQEIDRIVNSNEKPTFENTILALEKAGDVLEWVSGIFFNLLHSNSNDNLIKISEEVIPMLSELSTEIILNEKLFDRINTVYQDRDNLKLDEEDLRLLKNCYDGFNESGATLSDEKKNRLRELSQEMSANSLRYSNNIIKEQRLFKLYITDEEKVSGMPESALRLAKDMAIKQGYNTGWLFDLSAPSYFPFMQHCPDRESRKVMYIQKSTICAKDNEFSNKDIVVNLVNGRLEEANLLGYKDFSSLALHHRMAKNTENVYSLLDKLLEGYKPKAEKEIEAISVFAKENGADMPLESWDWSYWAEKYKQKYYDIDDEMLRPYFELSSITDAVFSLANNLYGISFHKRTDIDVYHKDVKVFEVKDSDNSFLGLLYTDFFPREGKQSGAWMNSFQDQYIDNNGNDHRPHIVLVMNFTPSSEDTPSLLTAGEVSTFLHEFGHSLHGLLTKCKYSSISGTSVARDFVELPSQLMENWLLEPEWLRSVAKHYKTGESIPEELIQKIQRSKNFLVGYSGCRQLSFGYLDMAWHTIVSPLKSNTNIYKFENEAWSKALLLPSASEDCIMSTSFSHIFSGGYSAGYYGYKWAEVLDADAFEMFIEGGLYNKEVAERFRDYILANGDKRDAMDLYKEFRGHEPNTNALLRRDGII